MIKFSDTSLADLTMLTPQRFTILTRDAEIHAVELRTLYQAFNHSFAVQRTPRQWDVAGIQRDGADEVVGADQTEEDEEQVE